MEKKKNSNGAFRIPMRLLAPVGDFLKDQLQSLERRRTAIEKDDPFVSGRADNSASPDTSAEEQFGHARIEAVRKELDRRIIQVRKALSRVNIGEYGTCESCGEIIDTDRLMVYPEATFCIKCEKKRER